VAEGGGEGQTTGAQFATSDVFISYASQDAAHADAIVAALEGQGLKCWIAPRDVTPGEFYAGSIVHAIDAAKATVLILSQNSAASPHVVREVERAASKRHPVISLRIDKAPLPADLEYFLNTSQWLDASGGEPARVMPKLVAAVRFAIDKPSIPEPAIAGTPVRASNAAGDGWSPRRKAIVAGSVVIVAIAGFAGYRSWQLTHQATALATATAPTSIPAAPAMPDKSVAVLPFVDMSEKKDQEYFADGMAEELLDVLVKIPSLKVIGRTSSFQFKGHNEDLRIIGSKLGATYVVEGSVRKTDARIRVTAQLIDTRSGAHLWADSYDRDFGDVLALQDQIATGIARALQVAVGADETRTMQPLRSPEAYTLYLRGRSAYDRGTAGTREGQSDFEQALALDPNFLRAAEWLALAYAADVTDSYVPSDIGWQHVREAADNALRIDANSAIAHTLLGMMHGLYEYDWAAAETELTRALASDSRVPIAQAYTAGLAFYLRHRDQAMRLIDASLSTDPLSSDAWEGRAGLLAATGDIEGAEMAYRKSLELSPAWTELHLYVGQMLMLRGMLEAALEETQLAKPYDGRDIGLAMIYHALGRKEASDAALSRLTREYRGLWPQNIAQVYAYRGESEQAFEWFEKAYAARKAGLPALVRDDPTVERLRTDPRYKALLRKMNLPE